MVIDIESVWFHRYAIKFLDKERDNFVTNLNAAFCNSKVKEDEKYRVNFANLVQETEKIEIELSEQTKIKLEVDKEIADLEIELDKTTAKAKKIMGPLMSTTVNIFRSNINYLYCLFN